MKNRLPSVCLDPWKDLQFFSDTIEEPVNIARYLPQGVKDTGKWENTIRIVPLQKIPWASVKSWLQKCEDCHGCDGQPLLSSRAPRVTQRTFIDVKRQALVTAPHDCRYMALSYVWGGISQLVLTKSNREFLFRDAALKTFERNIPQVIKDAMQVVISIGERFLWVDSLCIVQDDESVKHHLISEMASIYNRALATIVAASGENAQYGLPGVSENSRVLKNMVEIPGTGLRLGNGKPLNQVMDDSTYNTRGWTFQERLLSRRCLYFTETQIFFECQKDVYSEDRSHIPMETQGLNGASRSSGYLITKTFSNLGDPLGNEEERQLLRYSRIATEYSHKKFTFSDDILNAFAGIETAMEQLCGWTMVYGLPEQLLDRVVLWEPEGDTTSQEQRPSSSRSEAANSLKVRTRKKEVGNLEFPSWSWSAWIGGIVYNEWTASDLRVFHSPFKLVHPSIPSGNTCASQSKLKNHLKPSVLSFTTECLSGSAFSLKNETSRERRTCFIRNGKGQNIGIIPSVDFTFAENYEGGSVDLVLLSASKLAVHRFRSEEDMGYPSLFDAGHRRDEWSVLTILFVRQENGYAKRMALGYIHRDAWKEAEPKVKSILLA